MFEGGPGEVERVLPPAGQPLGIVGRVGTGDRLDVDRGRAAAIFLLPVVPRHVADRDFEQVAEAAAIGVGAGKVAA